MSLFELDLGCNEKSALYFIYFFESSVRIVDSMKKTLNDLLHNAQFSSQIAKEKQFSEAS